MKPHIITLAFITSLTAFAPLRAEPTAPPVATEMKELDRVVGTWTQTELVLKQAEWTPKEIRVSGDVAAAKPIMGGRYIEDLKIRAADGSEHIGLRSFDEAAKVYHYSFFGSAGNRLEFTFRWDAAAQSFIGTAPMPNGVTMHGTIRFPDKDTKEWHAVATDPSGKVYLDLSSKEVRAQK